MSVLSQAGMLVAVAVAMAGCGRAPASPVATSEPASLPTASASTGRVVAPAKIELRSVDRIREGGAFTLSITNVGGEAFQFQHPGASNGCGAFHWEVSAVNDKGFRFVDSSHDVRQMCTMAIVPPSLIVIGPGETVDINIDTEQSLFPSGIATEWGPVKLEPGEYTFFVNGAGLGLSTKVTITT